MKHPTTFVFGMLAVPLALLGIGAAIASSVATPNNFVAGTPAVAAQVNDNFAAHAAAINDNDTRITTLEGQVAALQAQAASAGNIRGFARVHSNGTLLNSWMANGNTPTVSHTAASGIYDVTFPGETITSDGTNRCILANCQLAGAQGWATVSGVSPAARIRTYDDTGTLTDAHFWVLITGAP